MLELALTVALAVPSPPGLLPDQARIRADCANVVLFLGDEAGDRMRERVWVRARDAWVMAADVVEAGWQNGLEPKKADTFMGVNQGYFQQLLDDGRLSIKRMREPGFERVIGVVTYGDMARLVRPSEEVSDGQIRSAQTGARNRCANYGRMACSVAGSRGNPAT